MIHFAIDEFKQCTMNDIIIINNVFVQMSKPKNTWKSRISWPKCKNKSLKSIEAYLVARALIRSTNFVVTIFCVPKFDDDNYTMAASPIKWRNCVNFRARIPYNTPKMVVFLRHLLTLSLSGGWSESAHKHTHKFPHTHRMQSFIIFWDNYRFVPKVDFIQVFFSWFTFYFLDWRC